MSISVSRIGTPVDTARAYDGCLVPRNGGGWNWIKPFYTAPTLVPCEFIIAQLEANTYHSCMESGWVAGKAGRYPTPPGNFGPKHQRRAPNGWVFMVAASCKVYAYKPETELVHDLGRLQLPTGGNVPDSSTYSMVFNESGTILAGGSVAASNTDHRPCAFTINPTTGALHFLSRIGSTNRLQNGYAYASWIVGNWLYVLVGEELWDVVAVNLTTGMATTLATETVNAFAYFDQVGTKGLTVRLMKNNRIPGQESMRKWWLVDGALVPYVSDADPIPAHDPTPYVNQPTNMPQIDESALPQHVVKWRPFGDAGPWNHNAFEITYNAPIPINSLTTLPDGSVFGDVEQYQGFFRIGLNDEIENLGLILPPNPGVSEGNNARCLINGLLYFSGYSNGVNYRYDPNKPWDGKTNPEFLQWFAPSGTLSKVKRMNALACNASPPREYAAGLCDRTLLGSGIGYYDLTTKKYTGHATGLNFYVGHLGLVVLPELGRVVFGGLIGDDPNFPGQTPSESALVFHDLSLVELTRVTPIPGMKDTGRLFNTPDPFVLLGLSITDQVAYRFDAANLLLLGTMDLSALGTIGVSTQDVDGNIVAVIGTKIVRIDPTTLSYTVFGDLDSGPVTAIAMGDNPETLLFSVGADVYRADLL